MRTILCCKVCNKELGVAILLFDEVTPSDIRCFKCNERIEAAYRPPKNDLFSQITGGANRLVDSFAGGNKP
jgi:hypothetical protein